MKIVFFGTSSFASRILSFLLDQDISIVAVVTRPDRPRGRSLQFNSPPVKENLLKTHSHIPVHQPEKASTVEFAEILKGYHADLFVVVAYGEIIKTNILSIPKKGCINIHASLLPKYRGAAPIQRSLMNGDPITGVTIMEMVLQMDAGDIIKQASVHVPEEMTYGELELNLSEISCPLLLEVFRSFEKGEVQKLSQDPSLVTYAAKITPEEEQIYWEKDAEELHNLIRALSPFPGAWCKVFFGTSEKRLKIKRAVVIRDVQATPGEVLSFSKEGFIVGCGKDALRLLEVQLEGKKTMSTVDFIKGMREPPVLNLSQ